MSDEASLLINEEAISQGNISAYGSTSTDTSGGLGESSIQTVEKYIEDSATEKTKTNPSLKKHVRFSNDDVSPNSKIECKICKNNIDISGMNHEYVVQCKRCNEATPIKPPPPGKKYVRCECNCLLVCKISSHRVSCPRPNCKRIINLMKNPAKRNMPPSNSGMNRVSCAHCPNSFLFNQSASALARCPQCKKVSSVGPAFARGKGNLYLLITMLFVIAGFIVTALTYKWAISGQSGYYFVYIGLFSVAIWALWQCIYYYTMRTNWGVLNGDFGGPSPINSANDGNHSHKFQ